MTIIEGDGIGPEISQSVKDIFSAANVTSTLELSSRGMRGRDANWIIGPCQVGARGCHSDFQGRQDCDP